MRSGGDISYANHVKVNINHPLFTSTVLCLFTLCALESAFLMACIRFNYCLRISEPNVQYRVTRNLAFGFGFSFLEQ